MQEKSDETRILLNPIFCGLIYASLVDGYNSSSYTPIPLYLPYVLMPIVLHKESRLTIPSSSRTKFPNWVQGCDQIRMGLPERATALKKIVTESSMFLYGQRYLELKDEVYVVLKNAAKIRKILSKSTDIQEYINPARILGSISGKNNSVISIMAILGVKL